MRSIAIAVAVAACGRPAPAAEQGVPIDEPTGHVAAVAHVEPPPRPPYAAELVPVAPRVAITAVHSDAIHALAVTDDGDTVVSADDAGGMRLWTTLDGTREPVVVTARPAQQLAITRAGGDVVIAGLDSLGQLELVRVSGAGIEEARISVAAPRPFVELHAFGAGFLAVRDDQTIAMFDGHGALAGELAAAPGDRIAALAVRGEHALAVLDRDGTAEGRWLVPGRRLAWGARTPMLPIDPTRGAALAPDGARLAAVTDRGEVGILELARGTIVATAAPAAGETAGDAPIAFLDDGALAVSVGGQAHLYVDDHLETLDERAAPATAAAGRLIIGANAALMIVREYEPRHYLGYASAALVDVMPIGDGFLATDGRSVFRLDAHLHAGRASQLPAMLVSQSPTTTLLDEHHALVVADGIYVSELDSERAPVRIAGNGYMGYSRASRVLVLYEPHDYAFARYDPSTGTFGPFLRVATEPGRSTQAFLLDPALAGAVAIVIEDNDETRDHEVTRVRATRAGLEVADFHFVRAAQTMWDVAKAEHAVGWGDTRVSSPDGTLVAESLDDRLVLRDANGPRWTQPARAVVWTPDGRLVAYGAGLAYVDVATGAIGERQCGWYFGLSTQPRGFAGSAALCELP